MTISVIIPVYNCENSIGTTLDRIAPQLSDGDEIVVVNDGSDDRTAEVLSDYAKMYNQKISVIVQENAGPAAARNTGIKNSSGEYLLFVDADDQPAENYVSKLKQYIMTAPDVDFAYGRYRRIVAETGQASESNTGFRYPLNPSENVLELFLTWRTQISLWNSIFKSDLIRESNLEFDETRRYGEDVEFIAKYLTRCRSVCAGKDVIYEFHYSTERELRRIARNFRFDIEGTEYGSIRAYVFAQGKYVPCMDRYTMPSVALNLLMRMARLSEDYDGFRSACKTSPGVSKALTGFDLRYASSFKSFVVKSLARVLFRIFPRLFYRIARSFRSF